MSELRQFIAMLGRAGIGHGTRTDYDPPGTSVQVECGGSDADFMIAEFAFDTEGRLKEVACYPGEEV